MEEVSSHLFQVSQLPSNRAKVQTEERLTPKPVLHHLPLGTSWYQPDTPAVRCPGDSDGLDV